MTFEKSHTFECGLFLTGLAQAEARMNWALQCTDLCLVSQRKLAWGWIGRWGRDGNELLLKWAFAIPMSREGAPSTVFSKTRVTSNALVYLFHRKATQRKERWDAGSRLPCLLVAALTQFKTNLIYATAYFVFLGVFSRQWCMSDVVTIRSICLAKGCWHRI